MEVEVNLQGQGFRPCPQNSFGVCRPRTWFLEQLITHFKWEASTSVLANQMYCRSDKSSDRTAPPYHVTTKSTHHTADPYVTTKSSYLMAIPQYISNHNPIDPPALDIGDGCVIFQVPGNVPKLWTDWATAFQQLTHDKVWSEPTIFIMNQSM